jgi:hypothetical protein
MLMSCRARIRQINRLISGWSTECSRRRVTPPAGYRRLKHTDALATSTNANHRPRIPVPAHLQPPEAAQPRQRPLDLPTMAAKPSRRPDPPPSDPRLDATPTQIRPVGSAVIALVGVDRTRAGPPPPSRRPDRRDVVHDRLEHDGVVDVGRGHHNTQRHPAIVTDQMELASRLATIDGICAHVVRPCLARTLMVSTLARSHSSRPCWPRRSKTCR